MVFTSFFFFFFFFAVNDCGATLTALSGEVTSPNYPGSYQSGRDCTWKIVVTPGSHLQLTFRVKYTYIRDVVALKLSI